MKTGGPSVRKTFGYDFWELLRRSPQASAAMNGAMRSASVAVTPAVTAAYKWSQFLHDWDDAAAAVVLGSLRRSMKPTARLIVVESVIPEGPAFNLGKWTDLQMLVCVGGRARTESARDSTSRKWLLLLLR